MVNDLSGARHLVVFAARSMPEDLHRMWRTRDAKGYQVEYGCPCMAARSPGGLASGWPPRAVIGMVGDGS